MIRSILLILFFLNLTTFTNSKEVEAEAEYKHDGKISQVEACNLAEQRAKDNAIKKALGLEVSLQETQKCSEVDGEFNCEQNQISILSLNGNITEFRILDKKTGLDEENKRYYCQIKIKANVEESIKRNSEFQLDVKLNLVNFRDTENLNMEILSNKDMFLTVYVYFPYEKGFQVQKLFPNSREKNNKISSGKFKLPTEGTQYTVDFPKNTKKARVDEHLIFIATVKNIDWLDKYSRIEDLRKSLNELSKKNIVLDELQRTYTIYK